MLRLGLQIATALIVVSLAAKVASAQPSEGLSSHGISVRVVPERLRPGDLAELRVEMKRPTWGQFALRIPEHPGLRRVAVEKVPVTYANQFYRQRESLLFQPVASGALLLTGATVVISTPSGPRTIGLPDQKLDVQPYRRRALSDAPELLPGDERAKPAASTAPLTGLTAIVVLLLLLIGGATFWRSRLEMQPVQRTQSRLRAENIVHELRSGTVAKKDWEQILEEFGPRLTPEMRTVMERAVYADVCRSAEITTRSQRESPL